MRPGGGYRLVLAALVLGLVLANADSCGRADATTAPVPPTSTTGEEP